MLAFTRTIARGDMRGEVRAGGEGRRWAGGGLVGGATTGGGGPPGPARPTPPGLRCGPLAPSLYRTIESPVHNSHLQKKKKKICITHNDE